MLQRKSLNMSLMKHCTKINHHIKTSRILKTHKRFLFLPLLVFIPSFSCMFLHISFDRCAGINQMYIGLCSWFLNGNRETLIRGSVSNEMSMSCWESSQWAECSLTDTTEIKLLRLSWDWVMPTIGLVEIAQTTAFSHNLSNSYISLENISPNWCANGTDCVYLDTLDDDNSNWR